MPAVNPEALDLKELLSVLVAVRKGDFSRRMPVDQVGLAGKICDALNDIIELNEGTTYELTRISQVVGKEGKLGSRASVRGAKGAWAVKIDAVNAMIEDMAHPSTEVIRVIGAVAQGDLTKKMSLDKNSVPLQGDYLQTARLVNGMVDQLGTFASEVIRVAREVGTEGILGGQANVDGVSGVWKDLTDNVNSMASNLTSQVRNIAEVTTAVATGDLSKKITVDVKGEIFELKNTINTMVDQLSSFAAEVTRMAREVGTEGKLGGQANVDGVSGVWEDLTDNVNQMASNLTAQVRNIAAVTTAVANGDLSRKITVDVRGEMQELKDTVNTMVDQLRSFASEVTRVAREVGTEGKLGGQADVPGVAGTWKDLTDNVNLMASNLTAQVRGIATVVTAVAAGDLKRKLALEAKGEIATLADTINGMIDTLATFAEQVTNVAREVGIEGKLGGQAKVPGADGTWRALTDNVNQLAANLTTQVRAIAEVATAVTKGDLTRSISVEALGEVAALKDNINQMILNLRETTRKNTEQDWLKTNLAKFTRILQGQRNLDEVARLILSELAPLVSAQHGVFYMADAEGDEACYRLLASYAYRQRKSLSNRFLVGEGLVGQCALEKDRILISEVPDGYIQINSGLGEAPPRSIVVLPVLFEGQVRAVIELASFHRFNDIHLAFLDQLTESIGIVINTIAAGMRTEELLKQSTALADELRSQQHELTETNRRLESQAKSLQASEERLKQQQEELQQTNEELEERSRLLQLQNAEVEKKNREIEQAKMALEERAQQLSLSSRYKSEFLANMSHELRTPLNSLLILSKLLAENSEGNLDEKQVTFAETIHAAGSDLLSLINDILDLSKIESGTMAVDVDEFVLGQIGDYVERAFRQIAEDKKLDFRIEFDPLLPRSIFTDGRRLQQILKNLLANAFKFTEQGSVALRVEVAGSGWTPGIESLDGADSVIAFRVLDTGIGIPGNKQMIIFEAFQQADGTTSRKYGGTGLGLSISRELAQLLGGEIKVKSAPGQGSAFILYVPRTGIPAVRRQSRVERQSLPIALPSREGETLAEDFDNTMQGIDDDRASIGPEDRRVLIIEDDPTFARILLELVREKGFKGVVAPRGETGLALAREFLPDAITLDLDLPGIDGWSVLDRLKHDARTRHIPVHVITASDSNSLKGLRLGALAWLTKPVSREDLSTALDSVKDFIDKPVKNLLVVEDDDAQRLAITHLIGNGDVKTQAVGSGEEALAALDQMRFDCVVLDLGLPDMSGLELIEEIKKRYDGEIPIVVYTGKELSEEEVIGLKRFTDAIVIKGARSPEHLLDETALFLHRVEKNLPESTREMLKRVKDPILTGRTVLVVDDDVRNIFALASVLERHEMKVHFAENGKKGLELLQKHPCIDLVLMDVMMPEMDGYETTRAIRKLPDHKSIPIIALTAKAMKGDREKCIESGASDYITKPVDTDQLLSLLRVWLYGVPDRKTERPQPQV